MHGYLFDVYFVNGSVFIWIKGVDGKFYRHSENYKPYFIIDAGDKNDTIIYDVSEVASAKFVSRLFPIDKPENRLMIMVEPEWQDYYKVLKMAMNDPRVNAIYDSDLMPVQKFLFNRLKVEPGSAVNFEVNGEELRIIASNESQLSYIPPFDLSDDIICDKPCWNINKREINDPVDYFQGSCAGRISIDLSAKWFKCTETGLAWLVERARFAFLPLGLAARWSSNKIIDSRNAFTLINRGFAVPKLHVNEPSMSMLEFVNRDRGGYTISPKYIGTFENVGVIDFDSEYPSIIAKYGISYGGYGWLIPEVIRPWLERRLLLKRLARTTKDEKLKAIYSARSDSLKLILVSEYGISGCSLNRFGNHFAFEEINKISRQVMLKAKNIADQNGFDVVYGDVDSLFVKKEGAKLDDYELLSNMISKETGLPMSVDKIFRVLAFCGKKTDSKTAALKRYFGITDSGQIVCRGIEARRSDFPEAIRSFQLKLIEEIYGKGDINMIKASAPSIASKMLSEFISSIRNGLVPATKLAFEKRLGKDPDKYHVNAPQKVAAELSGLGLGDAVRYLISRNGVTINYDTTYDWEKYALTAISAAKTVLEPLGIIPSLEIKMQYFY
ncbi:MAG: DNA polymerase domain-containing protein [Conexivisphaerales archaeon]